MIKAQADEFSLKLHETGWDFVKILLAYRSYLPNFGGVWTYVHELYRGLVQHGHNVDILAMHPNQSKYYLLHGHKSVPISDFEPKVKAHVNRYYSNHLPFVDEWIRNMEVKRYVFEAAARQIGLRQYDLIHAQCPITARAIGRIKPAATPLVLTLHSSLTSELFMSQGNSADPVRKKYIAGIEYLGPNSCNRVIVPSFFLRDLMIDYDVPRNLMDVIPYGVDSTSFLNRNTGDGQISRPNDKFLIVCPARLVYEKGHSYLLQALYKLKQEREDFVCWLVGDGEYRTKLELQAEALHLQNHVKFLGNRKDVGNILKQSDVFVLPSLMDNFPFAVIEAQLSGVPAIVTKAGGLPEMVQDEYTGLVSYPADSNSLYGNLSVMLANKNLRRRLAQTAKNEALSMWSLENMTNRTVKLYRRLLLSSKHKVKKTRPQPSIPDMAVPKILN